MPKVPPGTPDRFFGCDKVVMHYTNTNDYSWDDPPLVKEYCDVVGKYVAAGQQRAVTVFTHSMGNVVMGAGIGSQTCEKHFAREGAPAADQLGKAVWFGVQGPNQGTPIALYCKLLCQEEGIAMKTFTDSFSNLLKWNFDASGRNFRTFLARTVGCSCDFHKRNPDALLDTSSKVANVRCSVDYVSSTMWQLPNKTSISVQISRGRAVATQVRKDVRNAKTNLDDEVDKFPVIVLRDVARDYMWGNMCGTRPDNIKLHTYFADRVIPGADRGNFEMFFLGVTSGLMKEKNVFRNRGRGWMLVPETDASMPEVSLPDKSKTKGKDDNVAYSGKPKSEAPHGDDGVIPFWSCRYLR